MSFKDNIETRLSDQCILCEGGNFSQISYPKRSPGPIVKCQDPECGMVFVNPIENYESLIAGAAYLKDESPALLVSCDEADLENRWEKEGIQETMKEYGPKAASASWVLERIEKYLPNRGILLDFGTYCGIFLKVAKERGWEAYGLEPLPGPGIFARSRGLNVFTGTLDGGKFPPENFPERFDVITASQVFEHLVNPVATLAALKPLIQPGGLIVLDVPNIDSIFVRSLGKRSRIFQPDHLSFFNRRTLTKLATDQGFKVLETGSPKRTSSLSWVARELPLLNSLNRVGSGRFTLSLPRPDIIYIIAQKAA